MARKTMISRVSAQHKKYRSFWKSKYGGMKASDLKHMKEVQGELSQYKRMYAELAHENFALKDVIERKL